MHAKLGQIVSRRDVALQRRRVEILLVPQDVPERAFKRPLARKRLVDHRPHCVPVSGGRHAEPGCLLGRHVGGGARDPVDALSDARLIELDDQAEIEEDHVAPAGDHHVGRLQIAVNNVMAVQGHDPFDKLCERRAKPRLIDPPGRPHIVEEIHAVEQVHGEEPLRAVGLQAVQADEIGMADVRGRAEFTLEAVQLSPVDLGQHFEGRPITAHYVHRLEDDSHAAAPELADQSIVAQPRGGQRFVVDRLRRLPVRTLEAQRERCRLEEHLTHQATKPGKALDVLFSARMLTRPAPLVDLVLKQITQQRFLGIIADAIEIRQNVRPLRRLPLGREILAQRDDLLERNRTLRVRPVRVA